MIIQCGTKIHREHKTVLINIVFNNAYLQSFHELYDKTCTVKRGYFERRGNFERFAKSFCF